MVAGVCVRRGPPAGRLGRMPPLRCTFTWPGNSLSMQTRTGQARARLKYMAADLSGTPRKLRACVRVRACAMLGWWLVEQHHTHTHTHARSPCSSVRVRARTNHADTENKQRDAKRFAARTGPAGRLRIADRRRRRLLQREWSQV